MTQPQQPGGALYQPAQLSRDTHAALLAKYERLAVSVWRLAGAHDPDHAPACLARVRAEVVRRMREGNL